MFVAFILCLSALIKANAHLISHPLPPQCRNSNEHWLSCGPPCGDRRCDVVVRCSLPPNHCGPPGCYCNPGLVRDQNNNCILPELCNHCGPNEEMNKCGPWCEKKCPDSSLSLGPAHLPCVLPQNCNHPACTCKPGYYRHPNRQCVPLEQCPHYCPPNEVYNECGNACESQCKDLSSGPKYCSEICKYPGACVCQKGYYRWNGKCVLPSQCPIQHYCPPNEHWVKCAPILKCQEHCPSKAYQHNPHCQVTYLPCPGGCVCNQGYVRNNQEQCIPRAKCPRYNFDIVSHHE